MSRLLDMLTPKHSSETGIYNICRPYMGRPVQPSHMYIGKYYGWQFQGMFGHAFTVAFGLDIASAEFGRVFQ